MLRSVLSSSRVFSPSYEETGDEDLPVLPRHTKVIVTGNNRTKSELVGSRGVVKNAVGHGGWHWLVLESGAEVKLQRNALSVVEPPNGNEEEGDYEMDYVGSGSDVQEKASLRLSSNVQYNKQKSPAVKHTKPCTPASGKHKSLAVKHTKPCTPASTKSAKSAKSASLNSLMGFQPNEQSPQMKLNFSSLSTRSLLKYWRRFNLGSCNPDITKDELIFAVERHFFAQRVDEQKVIREFVGSAKKLKAKRNK